MTIDPLAPADEAPAAPPRTVPRWLSRPRNLALAGTAAVGAGLALNWGWLSAVGAAPILLSLLPCAAMCALGLCMRGGAARSCSTRSAPEAKPPAPDTSRR